MIFADVSATETARAQVRWYSRFRVAALVTIAGGLGACLAALADDRFRTVASAVVVGDSVAVLAGLLGTRLIRLREHARRHVASAEERTTAPGEDAALTGTTEPSPSAGFTLRFTGRGSVDGLARRRPEPFDWVAATGPDRISRAVYGSTSHGAVIPNGLQSSRGGRAPRAAWVDAGHGSPIVIGGVRQRTLLALLALRPGVALRTDRLIDDLWGDRPPQLPANALQLVVFKLRRVLGADVISTTHPGYSLQVDPDDVDADRFERLVREGRAALAAGRRGEAVDASIVASSCGETTPLSSSAMYRLLPAQRRAGTSCGPLPRRIA